MIRVIGGGLAGCECAYRLLKAGIETELVEMRPKKGTAVHKTDGLAELVCSNSLKSEEPDSAQGALKLEMKEIGSVILEAAERARVPAGKALAVERELFSAAVTDILRSFDGFRLIRAEATEIVDNTVIATGPLTSDALAERISEITGAKFLHFYDAVAPIVDLETVDSSRSYWSARYGKGGADYLNCPMDKREYYGFVEALLLAETVILKDFENKELFGDCLPVELIAKSGRDSLRYGPLRPTGLTAPDGTKAYAVVQLRKEDNRGGLANIVGFQTNLTFGEQKRVFSLIPALHSAEFVRYGVMHRNTYIDSPSVLDYDYSLKGRDNVYFAGQITGVEGYAESAMSGMLAGIALVMKSKGLKPVMPPAETVSGSLTSYVTATVNNFSPMHASFALTPPISTRFGSKEEKNAAYASRALYNMKEYVKKIRSLL